MKIPFLFGTEIDLVAIVVFIFTMIVLTQVVKWAIKTIVCGLLESKIFHNPYKLNWLENLIEKDGFKLVVSWICGFVCFYYLAKYGNKIPITDGSKIEITALTIGQYLLFTSLTCGGYKLLKPVVTLWIETMKNKLFGGRG